MITDTPTSAKTDRKRFLSSPMDLADSKKNKTDLSTSSVQEEAEEDTVDMAQSVTKTALSPSDLDHISKLLGDTFQDKMADMVSSIVDGVVSGLQTQIIELQAENSALKTRVTTLEAIADKAEQYSRRNSLRISGIPEVPEENTDDKVLELARGLGVELSISELDRSHRLGKRTQDKSANSSKRPRDIIVKFATFRSRMKLLKQKSKLKDGSNKGVFLNEDLTRERSQIFYDARKLVKSKHATSAWTTDGVIIVRDTNMRIFRFETRDELAQFKRKIGAP